jgi:thiamine-monophosphate kinase
MSGDPHVEQSGEDRLIAEYFRPMAKHPGAFALMDDAAVIAPPAGCDIVLKTDGIIGGVHFSRTTPRSGGQEGFAREPVDLAAKAARPLGFLLTLRCRKRWGCVASALYPGLG